MEELFKSAEKLVDLARSRKVWLATAESCTGGLVSTAITSVSGSSEVFDRGFITYSNDSKAEMLGVALTSDGAVSAKCAEEMAHGAVKNSKADIAVSITGIAGPGGGSDEKPVGLVYLGFFDKRTGKCESYKYNFIGDRQSLRIQAAVRAIEILSGYLVI